MNFDTDLIIFIVVAMAFCYVIVHVLRFIENLVATAACKKIVAGIFEFSREIVDKLIACEYDYDGYRKEEKKISSDDDDL